MVVLSIFSRVPAFFVSCLVQNTSPSGGHLVQTGKLTFVLIKSSRLSTKGQNHRTYLPPIPDDVLFNFTHQRYVLVFIPTFLGGKLESSIVSDLKFVEQMDHLGMDT